jgi:hypothetical protein
MLRRILVVTFKSLMSVIVHYAVCIVGLAGFLSSLRMW